MPTRFEHVTGIGRKIGINDEKGYLVAIFLALIIVAAIVAGYYAIYKPQPEPYSTIYLLDTQKQAVDYPVTLVANQNSTFNVWVNVENHLGGNGNQSFQILLKVTTNNTNYPVNAQPIDTYQLSLADGGKWQTLSSISENQVGSYSVVFELWRFNPSSNSYEFTNNFCNLNIQVSS
jgi:uncharacterized membrane protein